MVTILTGGMKIRRKISLLKARDEGFYGYVSLGGRKVKVTKTRGKGNKCWTLVA